MALDMVRCSYPKALNLKPSRALLKPNKTVYKLNSALGCPALSDWKFRLGAISRKWLMPHLSTSPISLTKMPSH